jgi:hypothetical protein
MRGVSPEPDRQLPTTHASLAYGVPPAARATIFVLSVGGGMSVGPKEGRTLLFGRNRPDVHVCVGEDDPRVSREHGALEHRDGTWWIRNTGRLPVRLPGGRLLFAEEEPVPLGDGYTPVFVRGSSGREHLLEVFVTGADGGRPAARHREATQQPVLWRLDDDERLVLVVLGQRYLLHEHRPQPLSWRQAADQLAEIQPAAGWTPKRVEHAVTAIRTRMSKGGVSGLTREEVGEPVGNALNDNLIRELVLSTTLVPPDLELLGDP